MTRDLEETLKELGPGYREVVGRLTAAYRPLETVRVGKDGAASVGLVLRPRTASGRIAGWTAGYLVAASLLVFLGLGVIFRYRSAVSAAASRVPRADVAPRVYTVAYAADETAVRAIVASQRADGSWSSDFITRQNAAALRGAGDAVSLVAYKRALRYLRSRGLEPLTDAELKARGARAARVLAGNC